MNWKYHIPHLWNAPREVWEDVYLLPDNPNYQEESIWLTIDALGDVSEPTHGSERAEFQEFAFSKLGDKSFWINGSDMIVRARDFNKEKLLDWVKVWLRETGFPVSELIETSFDEFASTNDHAMTVNFLHSLEEVSSS
ncbi:MAG: hypothetical protein NVS2B14_10990 [Chamaesiphon sp.]